MANENTSAVRAMTALVLAWLVPGAGHALSGRWARAAIIFITIAATFWAGVAMGGPLTVDRRAERWWFMAQMLTGVHGVWGWQRQTRAYDEVLGDPKVRARYTELARRMDAALAEANVLDEAMVERGIALTPPGDNIARAYSGVAGLLNLMCMFDAVMLALMGRRAGRDGARREGAQ